MVYLGQERPLKTAPHAARKHRELLVPAYSNHNVTLYNGSCFDVLPLLSRRSVNLILVDPPYSYKYDSRKKAAGFGKLSGDNCAFDPLAALELALPLLAPRREIYVFGKWDLSPLPLVDLDSLVWDKGYPGRGGGFNAPYGRQHEDIQYGRYRPVTGDLRGKTGVSRLQRRRGSVLKFPRVPRNQVVHKYQKPVKLMIDLIESATLPGETVLDFTAGVGSTLDAAVQCGRRAIGIEIDPYFCKLIGKRIDHVGAAREAMNRPFHLASAK